MGLTLRPPLVSKHYTIFVPLEIYFILVADAIEQAKWYSDCLRPSSQSSSRHALDFTLLMASFPPMAAMYLLTTASAVGKVSVVVLCPDWALNETALAIAATIKMPWTSSSCVGSPFVC